MYVPDWVVVQTLPIRGKFRDYFWFVQEVVYFFIHFFGRGPGWVYILMCIWVCIGVAG